MRLYVETCRGLRFCPRPLPVPLQAAEPTILARIDPLLATSIAGGESSLYEEQLARLAEAIERLSQGSCLYCGERAAGVAGAWEIELADGEGHAVLEDLVPLCSRCLVAYRLGRAAEKNLLPAAVERVAAVNKVPGGRALEVVERLLSEWRAASRARRWRVEMPGLARYGVQPGPLETLAREIVNGPYSVEETELVVTNPGAEASRGRVAEELEALCQGRLSAETLTARAREVGLEAETRRVKTHLEALLSTGLCGKPLYEALDELEGAWVIVLTRDARARLVEELAGLVREKRTGWLTRVQTPLEPREPAYLAVYTPSLLDVTGVAEAARALLELSGGGLAELVYKPVLPGRKLASYAIYRLELLKRG